MGSGIFVRATLVGLKGKIRRASAIRGNHPFREEHAHLLLQDTPINRKKIPLHRGPP